MEALLLLHFLGIGRDVFRCCSVTPRERNLKRLTSVLGFMADSETPQYLRRTVLALRLTGHVHSVCAQLKPVSDTEEPLLVRLAKGYVPEIVSADLAKLVGGLHRDPDLDCGACLSVLLAVALDLVARFRSYTCYPYAACFMCKAYNNDYAVACLDFLLAPEASLDVGFSQQLRRHALEAGDTEADRLKFLMSDPVQRTLQDVFAASAASSLPVERAFATTKRHEAPRLCHVASASRNQILRSFLRDRSDLLEQARAADKALRQAMRLRVQSLAWKLRADLVGRALGVTAQEGEQPQTMSKAHYI